MITSLFPAIPSLAWIVNLTLKIIQTKLFFIIISSKSILSKDYQFDLDNNNLDMNIIVLIIISIISILGWDGILQIIVILLSLDRPRPAHILHHNLHIYIILWQIMCGRKICPFLSKNTRLKEKLPILVYKN